MNAVDTSASISATLTPVRPLTGQIHPSVVSIALLSTPIHAEDHLLHAWDAVEEARRGERVGANVAYAERRLACALSEPVSMAVKARKRAAFAAEVDALRRELASLREGV